MNINKIAEIIKLIGDTASRNEKEHYLKLYENEPGLKEVLHFIFNPYIKTNIAKKKLNSRKHSYVYNKYISINEVIDYFKEYQTGTNDDINFAWHFINQQDTDLAKDLAKSIVTQDLKIGISYKTLNKVFGKNFIPVIGCMLGKEYSDVKDKMKGMYVSTRKIDGVRRLLIKENGKINMYSRSGKLDNGLVDIIKEAENLPDNTVYDGELEAIGDFENNLELRQATNSIGNRKGTRTGVTFNIFDLIPLDEFKTGKSKNKAIVRKMLIESLFGLNDMLSVTLPDMKYIKPVPILAVSSDIEVHKSIFRELIDKGEEGIMLVHADSLYEVGKRSNHWVKMKRFDDIDLKIVDFQEGTGKYKGLLGALIVDYKGNKVKVGSGFTDNERQEIWDNKDKYIGKTVEITHQGESKNKSGGVSLNCPIFKGIRYDK